MHLIWKRPDGFHDAQPEDFRRVALSNGAQLWLHRQELEWYPFQVSGDWRGQEQTRKLNQLVNLLDAPESEWQHYIDHYFDDDMDDRSPESAVNALCGWIDELKSTARGNTWEMEIVACALNDIQTRLNAVKVKRD